MESSNRPAEAHWLDPAQNRRIFQQQISAREYGHVQPVDHPELHYFAGQPGAGKSFLQAEVVASIAARSGWRSIMQIIGDDFRPYHPEYSCLLEQDDQLAAACTDHDSGLWVEQAITLSLAKCTHVALEGTFRRAEVVEATVKRYQEGDFTRELHVIAIHAFISRTRIIRRYLDQVAKEGHGRYTTLQAHDTAYDALPGSLATIAASDLFDNIRLYDGNGSLIASGTADSTDRAHKLTTALRSQRDTARLPAATITALLSRLNAYAEVAARYDRQQCLGDIVQLQGDIRHA